MASVTSIDLYNIIINFCVMDIVYDDGVLILMYTKFPIQSTFATSSTTLLSAGETFFTSLLSGRHKVERDDTGAIFIDS